MSSRHYRIRPGYSFRDSDDSTKVGGDLIELAPDMATQYAHMLEAVPDAAQPVQASEPAAEAPGAGRVEPQY